jgi:protein-tyrosine-phosphatase
MAQGILKSMLKDENITGVKVKSAGIAAIAGEPPTNHAIKVLEEDGIDISDHLSQPLDEALAEWADVIYVMTDGHRAAIHDLYPDFIDKVKIIYENGIEDPYGKPIESYKRCAKIIRESLITIINKL